MIRATIALLLASPICLGAAQPASTYPALPHKEPAAAYLGLFSKEGKPKPTYTVRLKKRFGARLNLVVDSATQAPEEKAKWQKIMEELRSAVDRSVESPKLMMNIPIAEARKRSIAYDKSGVISKVGAWTIALKGTAARYGFSNRPCAEFVGEVVRQAYARAGYAVTDDFNKARKNVFSSRGGASSVTNLSLYLNRAGWVPWDASKYIPVTGAPMMHMAGVSPGHAYLSGGERGRYIVDNANPQGRDLGQYSRKRIAYMYMHGVFFLPPGIVPAAWESLTPPQIVAQEQQK